MSFRFGGNSIRGLTRLFLMTGGSRSNDVHEKTVTAIVTAWAPDAAVPVIVTGALVVSATFALATSERVDTEPAIMVEGENAVLTPAGRPLIASTIVSGAPLVTLVMIATSVEAPATTLRTVGFAAMPKSSLRAAATIVSDHVAECVADALCPITAAVTVVEGADDDAEIVSNADPPAVTDDGLTAALTPAGSPVTENAIVWDCPLVTAVSTVTVAALPAATVTALGVTAIEKSLASASATRTDKAAE
jgi:hypothetical protein